MEIKSGNISKVEEVESQLISLMSKIEELEKKDWMKKICGIKKNQKKQKTIEYLQKEIQCEKNDREESQQNEKEMMKNVEELLEMMDVKEKKVVELQEELKKVSGNNGMQGKLLEYRKKLFFSTVVAVKLNLTMSGAKTQDKNGEMLYEMLPNDITEEQWNAWIYAQLT